MAIYASMDQNNTQHKTGHPDELLVLIDFFRKNGMKMSIAACAVLIIIAVPILHKKHKNKKLHKSSQALASARNIPDLEKIINQYSSTPAAPLAEIKLAKEYYDSGNYDIALKKYDEFRSKYPEHRMADVAVLGKIHCIEAKGQIDEALQSYHDFLEKNPGHFLVPQATIGKARCMESKGESAEAKAIYEDFIAANAESGWSFIVEEMLEELNKKISSVTSKTEE